MFRIGIVIDRIIWLVFCSIVFSIIAFGSRLELFMYSNLLFAILLFLMIIRIMPYIRVIPREILVFFPFVFFTLCSVLWSIDTETTIEKFRTLFLLSSFFSCFSFYLFRFGKIKDFFEAYIWAGPAVIVYLLVYYGIDGILFMINYSARMGNNVANSNGISVFFATCSTIMYYKFSKEKNKYLPILILLMFVGMAITGSKTGIIAGVSGIVLQELLNSNIKHSNYRYLIFFLRLIIVFIILYFIGKMPMFEMLQNRFEIMFDYLFGNGGVQSLSTSERLYFLKIGIEQFLETPILGTGIATSRVLTLERAGWATYLHNGYVELLACGGIIGFLLYYVPIISLLKANYKYRSDDDCRLSTILLILYFIIEFGSVEYSSKFPYILFALALASYKKAVKCVNYESLKLNGM